MADVRANFPNLKISVDNTASSDESDNEVEIHDDNDGEDSEGASVVENEKSESEDGEIDKDDVEFNVRLSSFAGHKVHNKARSGSELDQPDDKTVGKLSGKKGRNDKEGPPNRKHQVRGGGGKRERERMILSLLSHSVRIKSVALLVYRSEHIFYRKYKEYYNYSSQKKCIFHTRGKRVLLHICMALVG